MGYKKGLSEGRLFGLRRGTTRCRERAEASEQRNCRELSSRKACHKSSFKEIGETTWEFCGWGSTTTIMKNIDKALHRDTVLIVKHTAHNLGRMLDNQHDISPMPSTTGATMSNSAFRTPTVRQSLDEEHNLHILEKIYLMESGFSRRFCTSAHI
jgi:hypothetical protein